MNKRYPTSGRMLLAVAIAATTITAIAPAASSQQAAEPTRRPFGLAIDDFVSTTTGPMVATAQLGGAPADTVLRVHKGGDVGLTALDGETLWVRPRSSFYEGWGFMRPAGGAIPLGMAPYEPFKIGTDHAFALHDVTGDGIDDVAVAHNIGAFTREGEPFPGSMGLAAVTLLDGANGRTLWHHLYPGDVAQLLFVDGVLVVADVTGPWPETGAPRGFPGTTSTVFGYRFGVSPDGPLVAQEAWRHELPEWAGVLAVSAVTDSQFAYAWAQHEPPPGEPLAQVRLVDAGDGEIGWKRGTDGLPRFLDYDTARDEIVVAQDMPLGESTQVHIPQVVPDVPPVTINVQPATPGYAVLAVAVADGESRGRVDGEATLTRFLLADVVGDELPEWIVSDHPGGPTGPRVMARDAETGEGLWTHDILASRPERAGRSEFATAVPGLAVVPTPDGPRVLVGAIGSLNDYHLDALDGATGELLWRDTESAKVPFAFHLTSMVVDGDPAIVGSTERQELVAFRVSDGERIVRIPLLNDLLAVDAEDVNADGSKDLVAGSFSGGVFALDGTRLGHDPKVLWMTPVIGPVHDIAVRDLDGDETLEVVVASSYTLHEQVSKEGSYSPGRSSTLVAGAIDVFDAATGALEYRHEFPDAYVWMFLLHDSDGDGDLDIVVPQRDVTALDGADGSVLWSYRPAEQAYFSNIVRGPDGLILGQWFPWLTETPREMQERTPVGFDHLATHQVTQFAVDGATGSEVWNRPVVERGTHAYLWRAVASGARTPDGESDGVAFAYATYREESGNPERPRSSSRVDVLDPESGEMLYGDPISDSVPGHDGVEVLPSMNVVQYHRGSWRCVDTTGVGIARPSLHPSDVAEADFGPHGRAVLVANSLLGDVHAYSPDTACGQDGERLSPLARLREVFGAGQLVLEDFDDDGIDEIIALPHDWGAASTLGGRAENTFSIIGGGAFGNGAIAVLRVVDATNVIAFTERSAGSGQVTDATLFEALLTDPGGDPVEGATLTFTLTGEESAREFIATTDEEGRALVTPTLAEKPGSYELAISHAAEAGPVVATMPFLVDKEDSALELSVHGEDDDKALRARLSDLDTPSEGITDRTIDFYSDGELIGSSQTGADGVASLPVPPRHRGNNRTYEAVFGGDDFYLGSLAERAGKGATMVMGHGDGAEAASSRKLLVR